MSFVCWPRGGEPCIDDVCRSMGGCAWPPSKPKQDDEPVVALPETKGHEES